MKNIVIIINYFQKIKVKKSLFAMGLVAGTIASVLSAFAPIFYGKMIDGLMTKDNSIIYLSLLFYILLSAGHYFFYIINNYFAIKSYKFIYLKIQEKIINKISCGVNEDENNKVKTVNVINDSLDNVSDLPDQLSDVIITLITIIISFVILFNYNFTSALIIFLITVFSLVIFENANVKAEKYELLYRNKKDNLVNTILNIFTLKTIDKKTTNKYNEESEILINAKTKTMHNWVLRVHWIPMILTFIKGLFILYLIYIYFQNVIGIDDIVVIIAYYEAITSYSDYLVNLFTNLKYANVSMKRIDEILK